MLKLFKIEWLKIKTYRTFWVLFLGFIISLPLFYYFSAYKYMQKEENNVTEGIKTLIGTPFTFPKVWHSVSWFGGLFFVIIGMLFILLITNEVQYRTHRQNIIDGWSRWDFLKAKFSLMLFFVFAATLVVALTGFITGTSFSPEGATIDYFEGFHYIGYFALMAFMYLLIAYVISILVKRTGLSIILYFAFVCIVDNLLWLVLTLKGSQLGFFTPLETTDSLVPNPFNNVMKMRTTPDSSLLIATGVYIALFGFLIYNKFVKSDIKN